MRKTNYKIVIRTIAIILAVSMCMPLAACGAKDKASEVVSKAKDSVNNVVEDAKDTAKSVKNKIEEWYSEIDFEQFEEGWSYAVSYVDSTASSIMSAEYVQSVADAINTLKDDINSSYGSARGVAQEAGYAAERWVADTFNIDSAVRESSYKAEVVGSNKLGSVDVTTNYGEDASLKYYQSANGSAEAQAKTIVEAYSKYADKSDNPMSMDEWLDKNGYDANNESELLDSLYYDQTRIIPSDQISEATQYLKGKISKSDLDCTGMDAAKKNSYLDTLSNLKDKLNAPDGTSSKPMSYEEMQAVAELAKAGKFDPEDFGISLSQLITPKYIVKQAIGTGIDTALINAALTLAPKLYSIIKEAIDTGQIDVEDIKEAGIETVFAAGKGFIEGSFCNVIVTMCQTGVLGTALQSANPTIVGSLAVLVIDAIINGYYLVTGEITLEEYGNLMVDQIFITALALPVALILSYLGAPKILMIAGCMVGGILASILYYKAKEVVLEFVDAGGFEAVVPEMVTEGRQIASDVISSMNIKDQISEWSNMAISTVKDGFIEVKNFNILE